MNVARRIAAAALLTATLGCSSSVDPSIADDPCAGEPGRRIVTADWLNRSLTVLGRDRLVAGCPAETAIVAQIDLSGYEPGPLQIEIAPDGRTAVVSLTAGFFEGQGGTLVGLPEVTPGGGLLIVDLDTAEVRAALDLPQVPMGTAIHPDGTRAFAKPAEAERHHAETLALGEQTRLRRWRWWGGGAARAGGGEPRPYGWCAGGRGGRLCWAQWHSGGRRAVGSALSSVNCPRRGRWAGEGARSRSEGGAWRACQVVGTTWGDHPFVMRSVSQGYPTQIWRQNSGHVPAHEPHCLAPSPGQRLPNAPHRLGPPVHDELFAESHHPEAMSHEHRIPLGISPLPLGVVAAIHLHDQPSLARIEIHDVSAQRHLPPKRDAKLGRPQLLPQRRLPKRGRMTKLGGDGGQQRTTATRPIDLASAPTEVGESYALEGGAFPLGVAIDPEGTHAFVAHPVDHELSVVDLESGEVQSISWLPELGPTYVAVQP